MMAGVIWVPSHQFFPRDADPPEWLIDQVHQHQPPSSHYKQKQEHSEKKNVPKDPNLWSETALQFFAHVYCLNISLKHYFRWLNHDVIPVLLAPVNV